MTKEKLLKTLAYEKVALTMLVKLTLKVSFTSRAAFVSIATGAISLVHVLKFKRKYC